MRKTLLAALSAGAVVIASLVAGNGAATSGGPGRDFFRVTHVYPGAVIAQSACGGDTCVSSQPEPLRNKVPQGLGRVQLLVQMTIEYQTTPDDGAGVTMQLRSPGERPVEMAPGELRVRPGHSTTTTLTWVRRGVQSSERAHELSWSFGAAPRGDGAYELKATEVVLSVEAVRA